jgi:hypothetical protein
MNKNILNKLSQFEKNIELSEVKVDLAVADEIKSASIEVKKQYDSVFKKAVEASKIINDALSIGNKAFFNAQKYYQQGIKLEQQVKDLGLTLPSDIKKAIDELYPLAKLEGEQIIKELTQAKNSLK